MSETTTITLGDIGKVCMCKRIMKEQTSPIGDIPFYKISTFGEKADCYISRDVYEDYKTRFSFPKKGDILISAAGTLGRTVIYDGEDAFFQDSNIVWIDNDESKVINDYLYYFYQTNPWVKTFGSTIPRLYNDDIRSIQISFPPDINIQKNVVSLLKTLDSKISNNTAICSDLEVTVRLLYNYWFVQFDFPDENGKPYKSSGGKMVWNEELKREIPEGWESKSISDISKRVKVGFVGTVDKYYCSRSEGYPIVRPSEMSSDGINYSSLRHITLDFYNKNKKSQVHKNDILISRCGKDGIPNIYDSDEPAQVLNAVIIEPDDTTVHSVFINEMLKSDYSQIQIAHGTSGSVQGVINTEMIADIILPFNQIIATRFTSQIRVLYALMNSVKKENQQLASLRDFLLPMLMNGQVKVGKKRYEAR